MMKPDTVLLTVACAHGEGVSMVPIVTFKQWCLCGGHIHIQDAPGICKQMKAYWLQAHVGLGHGACTPGDCRKVQRRRRESADDFRQAMNDLRPA